MNLYGTLGLRRGCQPEAVTRAYRRMAQRYHPDRNPGDPEAEARFRDVRLAYDVLSDPARRRRYDETGQTDDPTTKEEQAGLTMIAAFVPSLFQAMTLGGYRPESFDVVAELRLAIQKEKAQAGKVAAEGETHRRLVNGVADRLPPDHPLTGIIKGQLAAVDRNAAAACDSALKLLEGVTYRLDRWGVGVFEGADGLGWTAARRLPASAQAEERETPT